MFRPVDAVDHENDDTASRPASHPASRPDWVGSMPWIVQISPDAFRRSGKVAAQQGAAPCSSGGKDPAAAGFQGR